jgi:hypothetical protein
MEIMKTTLNLPDDLVMRAKEIATREASTLTQLITEGLRLRLRNAATARPAPLKPLPVSKRRGGFRPGIDGRSNQSMFDAEDE